MFQPRMKSTLVALLAVGSLALTACGRFAFKDAFPGDKQVKINLKGGDSSGQSLVGDESQRAGLYEVTYGVTRGINVMVVGLLALTRAIVESPATESPDEDHAVWGPSDPKGLERLQYKATAERVAENEYLFKLLARDKNSTDEADFGEIYALNYFHSGPELGHGTITVDRDEHKRIDPMDTSICDTGVAVVTFANDSADEMKIVDIDFSQLDRSGCEDKGQMGKYHYAEGPDGAGDFLFSAVGNIHEGAEAAEKPLEESLTIRAQWTSEGAGRADVIVADGEIPGDLAACQDASCAGLTTVTATQCWDSSFISRHETTTPEILQGMILPGVDANGDLNPVGEASACPFAFADPAQPTS
ncbi:MAG: hypothetical protein ABIJ09_22630 [Pseudomonadota bacterium]